MGKHTVIRTPLEVLSALADAKEDADRQNKTRAGHAEAHARTAQSLRGYLMEHCRQAAIADYAEWLCAYLARGGAIYTWGGDKMPLSHWLVMESECAVPALYGTFAVNVIIPQELGAFSMEENCGHNDAYWWEGAGKAVASTSMICAYSDVSMAIEQMCWKADPSLRPDDPLQLAQKGDM